MDDDAPRKVPKEIPGRWDGIKKILTRTSPLAHPDFEPSEDVRLHGVIAINH